MLSLFDNLSAEDKEKIEGYIDAFGGNCAYPMDYRSASLEYLLRFWNRRKERLYKFFGNQFIIEREIDIIYPHVLLWDEMEEQITRERLTFVNKYYDWCSEMYNGNYALYTCLVDLISIETLCKNRYDYDSVLIPTPSGRPIALNKGCKAAKILAKIADAYELEGFEEFRLRHSRVLNHKRFKGTLCVSIHPLDYMTMSDNEYNWDSCMSWQKPGEYRQGTVESMNSDNVIVAYLKGNEDMELWPNSNLMWNNKRWRELFYVTPELVTQIRGYPYNDEILEKAVFDILFELMRANSPEYAWSTVSHDIRANKNLDLPEGGRIYIRVINHVMYNDFSGTHKAFYGPAIYEELRYGSDYHMELSGETVCLCCGEDWTDRWENFNTEYLMCPSCTGEYVCSSCGEYVSDCDLVSFMDTDDYICHYCAERIGNVCEGCNEWYTDQSISTVYLKHCEDILDDATIHMCSCCIENNPLKKEIGPITFEPRNKWTLGRRWMANSANCNKLGFNLFGIFGGEVTELTAEAMEYKASEE